MDDWDSASDTTPPDSVPNSSDAVSPPQPSLRRRRPVFDDLITDDVTASQREAPVTPFNALYQDMPETSSARQAFISAPLLKKAVPFVLIALALVISGLGLFEVYASIHTSNAPAIAETGVAATVKAVPTVFVSNSDATALVQTFATATMSRQIYAQATSGTPAINDPLSDDSNHWGLLNTDWGGTCAFTGGAYHIALSKPSYLIWCGSSNLGNLNNFALQVQMSITKGNEGGIVFGQATNSSYRINISSSGIYTLYQYTQDKNQPQPQTLISNSSPAIKTGLNQVNVVTILVNNYNFYFYVNNQFIASAYLSAYSQGGAGFAAESIDQATDVAFSNMKVWTF